MYTEVRPSGESSWITWTSCRLTIASPDVNPSKKSITAQECDVFERTMRPWLWRHTTRNFSLQNVAQYYWVDIIQQAAISIQGHDCIFAIIILSKKGIFKFKFRPVNKSKYHILLLYILLLYILLMYTLLLYILLLYILLMYTLLLYILLLYILLLYILLLYILLLYILLLYILLLYIFL